MAKMIDLTGKKFSRLTVVSLHEISKKGVVKWLCKCDCGNTSTPTSWRLRTGETKSCGCLTSSEERKMKHGHTSRSQYSSEYTAWASMKRRCYYEKEDSYPLYGGRGIQVCDRWLHGFDNFLEDMGIKPSPTHSIDRIDVNGNYEPSNCKWSTSFDQARNQRVARNSELGIKGVRLDKTTGKYISRIYHDGKSIYLGYFVDIEDAVEARKKAEIKYWNKRPS